MKNIRFKDDEKLSEIYEKVNLAPFRNYVYNFDGFGTYCNYLDEYECAIDDRDGKIEKYKEVIDRIEKYIEKETRIYGLSMSIELRTHFDNILGILKEVSK